MSRRQQYGSSELAFSQDAFLFSFTSMRSRIVITGLAFNEEELIMRMERKASYGTLRVLMQTNIRTSKLRAAMLKSNIVVYAGESRRPLCAVI